MQDKETPGQNLRSRCLDIPKLNLSHRVSCIADLQSPRESIELKSLRRAVNIRDEVEAKFPNRRSRGRPHFIAYFARPHYPPLRAPIGSPMSCVAWQDSVMQKQRHPHLRTSYPTYLIRDQTIVAQWPLTAVKAQRMKARKYSG